MCVCSVCVLCVSAVCAVIVLYVCVYVGDRTYNNSLHLTSILRVRSAGRLVSYPDEHDLIVGPPQRLCVRVIRVTRAINVIRVIRQGRRGGEMLNCYDFVGATGVV